MTVSTRSKEHIKFDDNDETAHTETETQESVKSLRSKSVDVSDSDSDSDDDAPEEEGIGNAKDEVEDQIKKQEQAAILEKQRIREKRKKENERLKEQQLEKKMRTEEMQKQIAELEKLQSQTVESDEEELQELPEDLLAKINNVDPTAGQTIPKHINFNDIDTQDFVPEVKEQIKKRKKNALKQLRKTTMNKGVVKVSVLSSNLSKSAPKKEGNVTNLRNKWLKRRSLNRK